MKASKKTLLTFLLTATALTSAPAALLYDLNTAVVTGGGQNTFAAATGSAGGAGGSFTGSLPTNLVFTDGGTNTFDYFIGKFSTSTLTTVGDTLSLNFTATGANFSTLTGQSIRFGLFNVGTATTGAGSTFNAATGYRADYGPANNPGPGAIRERNNTADNLFSSGVSPNLTSNSVPFTFNPNGTYSGSLTLELLAGSQVKITSQIGGTTAVSVTDTTAAFTNFNSFGFFLTDNGSPASLSFTNLTVTSVPEPGTVALLGLAGMAFLLRRRKSVR